MNKGSHPLNLYFPCCFKDYSSRVKQAFGMQDTQNILQQTSSYVQNWGKYLSINPIRYGLLPTSLIKLFNPKNNCVTGPVSDLNGCFLRQGIIQGPNNFFGLIADISSTMIKKISIDNIKNYILENLTVDIFNTLNKGNLAVQFQYFGIQSAFQNYLEYTLSDQFKNYEFFYDFLTQPNIFFPNGLKLIIIDYNEQNNDYNILCPNFCNKKIYPKMDVAIALRYNNVFEPIYQILYSEPIKLYNQVWIDSLKLHNVVGKDEIINFVNNNIIQAFDDNCINAKELSSKLINVSKIYNRFVIDKKYTLVDTIDYITKLSIGIKSLIKDSYNKIIGIVTDTNIVVPIYPQINNDESKYSINPVNYDNSDLPKFEDTIELYYKLSQISNNQINIRPIKYIVSADNIIGFITNVGIYVKVQPFSNKKVSKLSKTSTNYFEIDTILSNYRIKHDKIIYKNPLSLADTITLIEFVQEKYDNDNYKLDKIITKSNEVVAVKLKNNLYIQVKSEKLNKDIKKYFNIESNMVIDNLYNYLSKSIELSRLSDYKLLCLPVRGLMNEQTKQYHSLILETGLIVNLKKKFYIYNKSKHDPSLYIIESIIQEPLIDQIFGNKITEDALFIDKRILSNRKIKYINSVYNLLFMELHSVVQLEILFRTKQYILDIINNVGMSMQQKKVLVKPFIKILFELLIEPINTEDDNYPTIDNETSCSLSDCKLSYCKLNKINLSNIKSVDEFLILGLNELEERNRVSNKDITIFKKSIDNTILENCITQYNLMVSILNKKLKQYCRIKIIDNVENTRIYLIKNRIFNEIIQNNFKRRQIFFNYRRNASGERFKIIKPYELLLTSQDYNISKLDTLYNLVKQKYYNTMLPFDEINLELGIDSNVTIQTLASCKLSSVNKIYKITNDLLEPKLNISSKIDKSLVVPLTKSNYINFYNSIMRFNVTLEQYIGRKPIRYKITHLDTKKKLNN